MMNDIIRSIQVYKSQLDQDNIQTAYRYLLRYVMYLKVCFPKSFQTVFRSKMCLNSIWILPTFHSLTNF